MLIYLGAMQSAKARTPARESNRSGACCRPGGSKTPVPSFLWWHKTGQEVHFYIESAAG
jgi:hypothetical protein